MNPNQLASKLVGDGEAMTYAKQIRARLRSWYPRDPALKGSSWALTDEQVLVVKAWHKAKQAGKAFDAAAYRKSLRQRKAKAVKAPDA